MSQESLTLYKLMIMYMLDNLDFPLTTSQLSEFFVINKYTSYFHLQQSINELAESSFIQGEVIRNATSYRLTEAGTEALRLFEHKISDAIKNDILAYFSENNYKLRKTVDITADYYPVKNGEYMVRALVREKDSILLEMNINVVSKDQAIAVCDRWSERSDEVYNTIMKILLFNTHNPYNPEE